MSNPFAGWTQRDVYDFNASKSFGKIVTDKTKPSGVERESDLHGDIVSACRQKGWLAFHGSMAHRTKRTEGEPDFTIITYCGVYFVECKSRTGKLSTAQLGTAMHAERLGQKIHVVTNMQEFWSIVK